VTAQQSELVVAFACTAVLPANVALSLKDIGRLLQERFWLPQTPAFAARFTVITVCGRSSVSSASAARL
jgi:hypothetical protein